MEYETFQGSSLLYSKGRLTENALFYSDHELEQSPHCSELKNSLYLLVFIQTYISQNDLKLFPNLTLLNF